jgi:hypothetical protein
MRKVWKIEKEGETLVIDIAWDVLASGGGAIRVNGEQIDSWTAGVKFPGVRRRFCVNGRSCEAVQGWFTFKLFIDGEMQTGEIRQKGGLPAGARIWPYVFVLLALAALVTVFLCKYAGR